MFKWNLTRYLQIVCFFFLAKFIFFWNWQLASSVDCVRLIFEKQLKLWSYTNHVGWRVQAKTDCEYTLANVKKKNRSKIAPFVFRGISSTPFVLSVESLFFFFLLLTRIERFWNEKNKKKVKRSFFLSPANCFLFIISCVYIKKKQMGWATKKRAQILERILEPCCLFVAYS